MHDQLPTKNRFSPLNLFFLAALLMGLLVVPLTAGEGHAHDDEDEAKETAVCNVCRVHEGENDPEPVVATADFGGETYGFCSADCRDKFEEAPESYLPPVFPRPAPAFTVQDMDGNDFSSQELDGRVVLLDFWATWCLPCVQDLPKLSRLHESYKERGVSVLSVSIEEERGARRKILKMMKKQEATHPAFLDQGEVSAWASYNVRVVPAQFLINQDGEIVAQWSGVTDLEEVEKQIARLLE